MKRQHAFHYIYRCPVCDREHQFHVLWINGHPDLAGPTLCCECGKLFSTDKILVAALTAQDSQRN